MRWLFILSALLAGAFVPMQAGLNSQLARNLGHPILASFVSLLVGMVALLLCLLVLRVPLPSASVVAQTPWYLWIGGLLGAFLVSATIIVAPVLGAATMIGLVITGQMLTSLFLDQFGFASYPVHPINFWRGVGAILLIFGVVLIQRN